MHMEESLYIVIPAYNEADNIRNCVEGWYQVVLDHRGNGKSRLVVVDDGSKDDTLEILDTLKEDHEYLIVLLKKNGGHGSAVLHGYRHAINKNTDWVFQTDSDGQTDPKEFNAFWNRRNEYDAILGNRIERGDGKDRKFVENTVCFLLWIIFGVKVPDANAPFRLMRTELVRKYIDKLPRDFNVPNIMLTAYFAYFKEKVKFVPISFQPRRSGENSVNPIKIVRIGIRALFDFVVLRARINEGIRI